MVVVLNVVCNLFLFFLFLIVCMGYGVVKFIFGKIMIYVCWFVIVYFVFGIVYVVISLVIIFDNVGKLGVLFFC